MNKYVCHPNGNDLNGGGFYASVAGTPTPPDWSAWHNNFEPKAIVNDCAIHSWSTGVVEIYSAGNFSSSMAGVLVYCDFSDATYEDGRYLIVEASSDYIRLSLPYVSDTPTVNVRVGGALLSPKAACDLGNGEYGHEVLFPCNQTTQTINEVDGTTNAVVMATEGATLNIYGVDEATGVLITSEDSNDWPVIKGVGSWTDNTGMFTSTAALCYSKVDKILFDGNTLVPRVVYLGDTSTDKTMLSWGDVTIKKSKSNGTGLYAIANLSYFHYNPVEYIKRLVVDSCYNGIDIATQSSRYWPSINYMWINNCSNYGLNFNQVTLPSYLQMHTKNILVSNCAVGIFEYRYDLHWDCLTTFVGNVVDIKVNKYSTTNFNHIIKNCLFYNSNASGKILDVDDDNYVDATFVNCVFGDVDDASDMSRFSGITPTRIDCEYIQANPFVDSANEDYRLNPAFVDLAKIYDWTKQVNNIGATSVAEPVGGSGGVSASRIFGGL